MIHPNDLTSLVVLAAPEVGLGTVFVSEFVGTTILLLMGCGVVANVLLPKAKGEGSNMHMIAWGWGIAVFAGVYVAYRSGAHINPAVTVGLLVNGASEYAPGVAISVASTLVYLSAQFSGAFLGGVLTWLAYRKQFDAEGPAADKLGVFATAPEVYNPVWNVITEVIATYVLVFVILTFGETPSGLGPLAVALLVVGVGASLGGPTGYAINPARDLGPRLAHALLPFRGKGSSDWGYAWIPVVAPLIGATLAGWSAAAFLP